MTMQKKVKKHFLKIFSVLVGLILWVYVILSQKIVYEKVVKIDYVLPDGMSFSEKQIDEALVYIEGPKAFAKTIQQADLRLKINLPQEQQVKKNIYALNLPIHRLTLPIGMSVQRSVPTKIYLQIEKMMYRSVPLKLNLQGQLSPGLVLEGIQLKPKEIDLFGPKSILQRLTSINLRPIDLDQIYQSEEVSTEVLGLDDRVTPSLSEVKVMLKVKGLKSNVVASKKEIQIKNSGQFLYELKTKVAQIKLFHIDEQQRKIPLNSDQVIVWAEIPKNAKKGTIELPLKVDLPHSYRLIEVAPKSILVNIQ